MLVLLRTKHVRLSVGRSARLHLLCALLWISCGGSAAGNEPPYISTFGSSITFIVGQQREVLVTVTDKEDSAAIRFAIEDSTILNLAARATLLMQPASGTVATAIFRWTPQVQDVGKHQIKFRAWDPNGGTTATRLHLTVVRQ